MTVRILIDQDSTIYDLSTPWYKLHNDDFGHIHTIHADVVYTWDTRQICRDNKCPADIYGYFNHPSVWSDGTVIENSQEVTRRWKLAGHELGIITTAANALSIPYKVQWLQQYFSHIENVMVIHKAHIKHWLEADFLIDDGIHNHKDFKGISILFNTAWNQESDLPRANDWNHVERIVSRGVVLLQKYTHKFTQLALVTEIKEGIL